MLSSPEVKTQKKSSTLESYFDRFRSKIVGVNQAFTSPYGEQTILYADWTASGRLYEPIERTLSEEIGPFVGNTHTETSITGTMMTLAYHEALHIIKEHVGGTKNDIIISEGSGMTGVINKLQRIMGLRIHEKWVGGLKIKEKSRPVVFITHMEHHSNHTSWLETIADVVIIRPTEQGDVDLDHLEELLVHYDYRTTKIASVTACSNVTGIETPYYQVAEMMHQHNGLCFVDFACSGPYVDINMHPENPLQQLDAVFLSPHKFLGGPGSSGIVVFGDYLYNIQVPDHPGGGTVYYTNPWNERFYLANPEEREDGGTPAFLQTIKAALAVKLKEDMTTAHIREREEEILDTIWQRLATIPNLKVYAGEHKHRLGVISFNIVGLHYNLGVRLLNDRFGIQVRGGCSCAGTYGHYLHDIDENRSHEILQQLQLGHLEEKPGWIRMSIHPTMRDTEVEFLCDALTDLAQNFKEWSLDYRYLPGQNDFEFKGNTGMPVLQTMKKWFKLD